MPLLAITYWRHNALHCLYETAFIERTKQLCFRKQKLLSALHSAHRTLCCRLALTKHHHHHYFIRSALLVLQ